MGHSPLCPEAHTLYSGTFHIRLYGRRMSVPHKVLRANVCLSLVQSIIKQQEQARDAEQRLDEAFSD